MSTDQLTVSTDPVEDPIDVLELAVLALSQPAPSMPGELALGLAAWLAESAREAREWQEMLRETRFPATNALLTVTYRHPVEVARQVLQAEQRRGGAAPATLDVGE